MVINYPWMPKSNYLCIAHIVFKDYGYKIKASNIKGILKWKKKKRKLNH